MVVSSPAVSSSSDGLSGDNHHQQQIRLCGGGYPGCWPNYRADCVSSTKSADMLSHQLTSVFTLSFFISRLKSTLSLFYLPVPYRDTTMQKDAGPLREIKKENKIACWLRQTASGIGVGMLLSHSYRSGAISIAPTLLRGFLINAYTLQGLNTLPRPRWSLLLITQ